jgi:hypothetical protein
MATLPLTAERQPRAYVHQGAAEPWLRGLARVVECTLSQRSKEAEKTVPRSEGAATHRRGINRSQGFALECQVGLNVLVSGLDALMPQPHRDHRQVGTRLQQVEGGAVAPM